jgi:hypothetical protein
MKRFHRLLILMSPFVAFQLYFGISGITPNKVQTHPENKDIVVDILSIGSKSRMEYLESQQKTFASHSTVRNFFYATEQVDADQECSSKFTNLQFLRISNFCHKKQWRTNQMLMEDLKPIFSNPDIHSTGWLCAQKRPVHGLFKLQQHYRETGQSLPDYLIIIDDDSFYNMDLFEQNFQGGKYSMEPRAVAGCRIIPRLKVSQSSFSFPYGGFGLTLSRGFLEALLKPLDCSTDRKMCFRLAQNQIGEYAHFQKGMSVMDVIQEYAATTKFTESTKWTHGYCMHSDVMTGYLVDLVLSTQDNAATNDADDASKSHLQAYTSGSEWLMGVSASENLCTVERESCHADAEACHYATPEIMKNVADQIRAKRRSARTESNKLRSNGSGPKVIELR